MGSRSIRPKVRRRKVANLAANSRRYSVRNCTIPKADKSEIIEIKMPWGTVIGTKWHAYKMPEEGYPQPKSMMKKHVEMRYNKETHMTEKVLVASTFPTKKYEDIQKSMWKNIGKAAKMKAYEDEKMKKWEKKYPKPCPTDDLFKDEFIPAWENEREEALIRIRDFVVSMFDKLPLTGRYKEGDNKFTEKPVAELKDIDGEGHKINDLDPKKSKLLDKAQKVTNKEKANNAKLVATNLKDHKRTKGRIILPEAA